ncbi:hypothetical protein [Alistipes sp. ZOR0009]|uniref:hypothetical protein n=1 Tax=Alistipes sp. ZOR0009 TaxID=1339253 RepID=UPI001E3366A0|nr:hypothetical protein [Alistipes sp. ZOR0009]
MKRIFYLLIAISLFACNQPNKSKSENVEQTSIPSDVKYEIISEEPNEALSKDNVSIRINKTVDESALTEIAYELKSSRSQYDKLWIFYYLPEMDANSYAWATTHFKPELQVEINNPPISKDSISNQASNTNGEVIGKWRCDKSLMGASLILYKNIKGTLLMKTTFTDGSASEEKIKEKKKSGITKYEYNNAHGEYYILESNGNLGLYGKNGKFDEAVKVD